MPRKKKPPSSDEEKQKSVLQDAQSQTTVSSTELEAIMKQIMQQFDPQGSQQQSKQESSTPSGSSTQKQQMKPASTKKTLQSYSKAFGEKQLPTKTFGEALKTASQVALVPIPTMISKQEYDRMNQPPQVLKIQPKNSSSSSTQIASASSSKALVIQPAQTIETPYFHKLDQVRNIVQMEPEIFHQNPNQAALNVFPSGWHFRPVNFKKTREFYELILIASGSIELDRKVDKKDKSFITHSTFQILKVLTPSQWEQDLNKSKSFGINYDPEGYSYWDYVDAWSYVFWDQNKIFKHTWFIYFKTKTKYEFPHWFVNWWNFFGPVTEIFPPRVLQSFELFKSKFNIGEDHCPVDLHYFSKLSISWIFSWSYRYSQTNTGSTLLPILQRLPSVRWWAKFQIDRIDETAVNRWFKQNPRFLCQTEQSKFLNQKSRIQSILASTSDRASMVNQLNSMLQILQQQDQTATASQSISSSASENPEDDEEEEIAVNLDED